MRHGLAVCTLALALLGAPLRAHALGRPPSEDGDRKPFNVKGEDPMNRWLHIRSLFALAAWPDGLYHSTRVQLRTPLARTSSIVLQNTYVGIGAQLSWTPAYLEVGPRFTFAPLDIFDVSLQASWVGYTGNFSGGLLPFDEVGGKLNRERADRGAPAGSMLWLSANPGVQFKVGPVIGVWSAEFAHLRVLDKPAEEDSPYVFEAYRDLVIEWADFTIDQTAAVLFEPVNNEESGQGPTLRFGPMVTHARAFGSGDERIQFGGIVTLRPGQQHGWPTFFFRVLPYLRDADRVGREPRFQLGVVWSHDRRLPGAVRRSALGR